LAFFARPGRGADPDASLGLRGRMNAELAQYVYPKRKAVEVAADQDAPPIHRVAVEMVRTPQVRYVRGGLGGSRRQHLYVLLWIDALYGAITDNHNISVISISYGSC
jgi:hypothetical protein